MPSTTASVTSDDAIELSAFANTVGRGAFGANTLISTLILQAETGDTNDYFENNIGPIYQ